MARRTRRSSRSLVKCNDIPRNVTWAEFSTWEPSFIDMARRNRSSGAQAHGIRYERKAQAYLTTFCAGSYVPSPWFRYCVHNHPHWHYCQPDGLIFDFNRNLITIVEIKLGHSLRAWRQIRNLYEPVVCHVFGKQWGYAACEVTSYHDPSVVFPERLHHITRFSSLQPGQFGLYIARERKLNEYVRHTRSKRR